PADRRSHQDPGQDRPEVPHREGDEGAGPEVEYPDLRDGLAPERRAVFVCVAPARAAGSRAVPRSRSNSNPGDPMPPVVRMLVPAVALALLAPAARADAPRHVAIHAAHWIDVQGGAEKGPVWVVVSGDTIEAVRASAPGGMETIELGDATLL